MKLLAEADRFAFAHVATATEQDRHLVQFCSPGRRTLAHRAGLALPLLLGMLFPHFVVLWRQIHLRTAAAQHACRSLCPVDSRLQALCGCCLHATATG